MRSKLGYLTGVSLKRKIKTKWFLIANLLVALLVIALVNIDNIIDFFGGDFNNIPTIYVVDNANSYEILKNEFDNSKGITGKINYNIILSDKSLEELKKLITENEDEKNNIILTINESLQNTIDVSMITKEYVGLEDTQIITNAVNNTKVSLAIEKSSISTEELTKIYSSIEIQRELLDETKTSETEKNNMILSTVFPVLIMPVFILTIFLIQMIGAEVSDEKSTRGMEIIISNVSPKIHFFSKIIAGNLFVILQGLLILLYGVAGIFIRNQFSEINVAGSLGNEINQVIQGIMDSGLGNNLVYIIPLTIILLLITFLAYSLLAGILASMTTNTEDYQQMQTPLIIISLVGFYLSMMSQMFDGALFIKIFGFIPLISSILAPSLLIVGQFGVIEMIISICISIVFVFILIKYGLKIYKVGILNYSSKDLWKKMGKALKQKN